MIIIKRGKKPKKVKLIKVIPVYEIITCDNCNTVFRPEEKDIKCETNNEYVSGYLFYFKCPVCKKCYNPEYEK